MVKGDTNILDPAIEQSFINIKRYKNEFHALTNNTELIRESMGNNVVIEEASLEDIMYYAKGAREQYV